MALNHLSQLSFRLLLEDALQPADLLSEGEGRMTEAEALICCLARPAEAPCTGEGRAGVARAAGPSPRAACRLHWP